MLAYIGANPSATYRRVVLVFRLDGKDGDIKVVMIEGGAMKKDGVFEIEKVSAGLIIPTPAAPFSNEWLALRTCLLQWGQHIIELSKSALGEGFFLA